MLAEPLLGEGGVTMQLIWYIYYLFTNSLLWRRFIITCDCHKRSGKLYFSAIVQTASGNCTDYGIGYIKHPHKFSDGNCLI